MMEYKGYRAAVTFDDTVGAFLGTVVDTRDVITWVAEQTLHPPAYIDECCQDDD